MHALPARVGRAGFLIVAAVIPVYVCRNLHLHDVVIFDELLAVSVIIMSAVQQNPPHRLRCCGEKMALAIPCLESTTTDFAKRSATVPNDTAPSVAS
jgi:hypothetical protein